MADPITIIGLAASVVQIVDVTARLISKSCEIYVSSEGAFQENSDLELIIVDLQSTNAKVAKIPLQFDKDNDRLDSDDRAIRKLCVGCNEVADELLSRLALLKVSKNDKEARKLESVKYAWKFMRSKRDLDALAARVAAYRDQLQNRIVVRLTERFEGLQLEQSWRFDTLERTGRDILDSIKQSRNLISADLGTQTDYLTRLAKAHHEEILEKLAVIATVQGQALSRASSPVPPRYGELYDSHVISFPEEKKMTIHGIVERGEYSELQDCIRVRPDAIFDVNASGETPLHIAARKGNLKIASYLLRKGAKKNADDRDDQTPLHLAVQAGHIPLVRFLVSKGADPQTEDLHGKTPVEYAKKDTEIAWILNVGADLEDEDEEGCTALRSFVRLGDVEAVKSLLDQGADIEDILQGEPGYTVLFEAGGANPNFAVNLEMMDILLSHGADVEARDSRSGTVLVVLAWSGQTAAMSKLLDNGADINEANELNFTALHEVCYEPHVWEETALMLIERGADLTVRTIEDYTPLSLAAQAGSEVIVKKMLEFGADINLDGSSSWTPLHEACEHGHTGVVEILLEQGADVNATLHNGHTPIVQAVYREHVDVVRAMLENVKMEKFDLNETSALGIAAQTGNVEMVELLLRNGAKADLVYEDGNSPIRMAQMGRHGNVVDVLKRSVKAVNIEARAEEVQRLIEVS